MLSQVRGEHVCGDEAREMLGRAKIKMYVTCTDSLTANKEVSCYPGLLFATRVAALMLLSMVEILSHHIPCRKLLALNPRRKPLAWFCASQSFVMRPVSQKVCPVLNIQ